MGLDVCCYLDLTNLEEGITIIQKVLMSGIPVITVDIQNPHTILNTSKQPEFV